MIIGSVLNLTSVKCFNDTVNNSRQHSNLLMTTTRRLMCEIHSTILSTISHITQTYNCAQYLILCPLISCNSTHFSATAHTPFNLTWDTTNCFQQYRYSKYGWSPVAVSNTRRYGAISVPRQKLLQRTLRAMCMCDRTYRDHALCRIPQSRQAYMKTLY
jgi:hypothetical protein